MSNVEHRTLNIELVGRHRRGRRTKRWEKGEQEEPERLCLVGFFAFLWAVPPVLEPYLAPGGGTSNIERPTSNIESKKKNSLLLRKATKDKPGGRR
jgi:hypothetical protein